MWILHLIAALVPSSRRDEWLREWSAEVTWWRREPRPPGRLRIAHRLAGACVHALWLRKEHWSFDMLWQDLKYAVRMLAGGPSFTVVAALTLALGIGANAAIFSIVYGVLLKPLPFEDPDRLVQIWETNPLRNWSNATAAPANLLDWRAQNRVFEDIAYYPGRDEKTPMSSDVSLATAEGEPVPLRALRISTNVFDVLGVQPAVGRTFDAGHRVPGSHRVAILGHELWSSRYGSAPDVVGREIRINAVGYTVIGVMPRGFVFPAPDIQLWTPFPEPTNFAQQRRPHYLRPIARLKPGVTLQQARGDLEAIARSLEQRYPDTNTQMGVGIGPLHDWVVGDVKTALVLFVAAVGLVLLVACANVANLLLARAAGRSREFAIRGALGAARGRIVAQLLTESLLLVALGGALGFVVAQWTLSVLIRLSPADLPRLHEVHLDRVVVVFMIAVTGLTAFLFGLAPAWQSSRIDTAALKDGGRTGTSDRRRTRRALVVAQVAASVALVACAGLLVRSFERRQSVPLGFDPENVLTFRINLPAIKYDSDGELVAFYERFMERLREVPGVTAAGASTVLGLEGSGWTGDLFIQDRPEVHGRELRHKTIVPGYFAAVGLPLLRGRDLAATDDGQRARAVVVNEALVRAYFSDRDPIGQWIAFDSPARNPNVRWSTIVGVVTDERQDSLGEAVAPEVYESHRQSAEYGMAVVVRARVPLDGLTPAVRRELAALEPSVAMYDVRTLEEVLTRSLSRQRFTTWLVTVFAAVGLTLAAVGVYGIVAFSVSRRTREIGVRVALGATRRQVISLVVREAGGVVVIGLALGLVGAAIGARSIRSLLFQTAPGDPLTYLLVVGLLGLTALIAAVVPARRALAVQPTEALRYE